MTQEEAAPLIKRKQVAQYLVLRLGVSYSHAYARYVKMQGFPKPIKIPSPTGKKPSERWLQSQIDAWIPGSKGASL